LLMCLESLYGDGGETCVPSNPIPNGSVWGTTGEPQGVASAQCQHPSRVTTVSVAYA